MLLTAVGTLDFESFLNIVASRKFDDEDHEDALKVGTGARYVAIQL